MGKAVPASQAAGDLLAGNADDRDRIAALTRGLGKRLDHGIGIGALTRAAAQYNDMHKNFPSSCRRRTAFFCFNQNGWSYSIASFQALPLSD